MNNAQLLQAVTQLQMRLLGRLLLDTPEDVPPVYAAALLRVQLLHSTNMHDRRRAELLELAELLERLAGYTHIKEAQRCQHSCKLAADVVIERPTDIGRQVKACCAAHAQELLELPGEGWIRGVSP